MKRKALKKTSKKFMTLILSLLTVCWATSLSAQIVKPAADQILFLKLNIQKNPLTQIETITLRDTFLRSGKLKESSLQPANSSFSSSLQFRFYDTKGKLLARQIIENPLHKIWEYVESDQKTLGKRRHETVEETFYLRVQYQHILNDVLIEKTESDPATGVQMKESLARLQIEIPKQMKRAAGPYFTITSLLVNGPRSSKWNIVIMGDGYTASQQSQFVTDAQNYYNYLFATVPYNSYRSNFNVYAISVISNVSGASMNPAALIDNYFGSTYWYGGIERLLVPTNTARLTQVLADHIYDYDLPVVIVNHTKYGGSGGWICTASLESSAKEIFVHEAGHTFTSLRDEYWAGNEFAVEGINMTQNSNPATIKWKAHLNLEGIGIYPHSESPSWYRPHQSCKMRYLGYPFCRVCRYGIIAKIQPNTAPTITTQPVNKTVAVGQTATFSVVAGGTAPLSFKWYKRNVLISGATSANYTTPATTTADNGATYYVNVSNSAGNVNSNTVTLTVTSSGGAPTINLQVAVTTGKATCNPNTTNTVKVVYWVDSLTPVTKTTSPFTYVITTTGMTKGSSHNVYARASNSAGQYVDSGWKSFVVQ